MNELYQSGYESGIYTPIYLPPIVFYDEENEIDQEVAEA